MRGLNERERNLGVFVLTICLICGWVILRRNIGKQRDQLLEELRMAQEKKNRAESVLLTASTTVVPVAAPGAAGNAESSKLTLTLLKDLTLPQESENIRIVSVSRTAENSFRMELQGKFPEMMRFFSYLERNDSRFQVASAELTKAVTNLTSRPAGAEPSLDDTGVTNEVRGVIQIFTRG